MAFPSLLCEDGSVDIAARVFVILKLTAQIALVRSEVEVAVAAEAEQNDLCPAFFPRGDGFVHSGANRVGGFGRGQYSLGSGELQRCLEARQLRIGFGLNVPQVEQVAEQRRCAVVAQPARVDARRNEIVAEGIHLDERRELGGVRSEENTSE